MAKYSKKSQEKVERAMHEMKRGKLKSGRSGKKVKSRQQAIAIGLSEAREAGAKVPRKAGTRGRTGAKKSGAKKTARKTAKKSGRPAKKSTARKSAPKKSGAKKTARKRRS